MKELSLAKWIRWLIYASALVPLVIFSQFISPFHFGKVIVFRTIVQVMAALYVMLVLRDRRYLPGGHPLTWALLVFALAFTFTTITSIVPIQSFWGTLERMGGLFTFWHYFAFYLIATAVMRTRNDWRTLVDVMVAVGLVSAFYGFFQRFSVDFIIGSGGRERIFGTIGNPALFAGYQILIAFLAATLSMTHNVGPAVGAQTGSIERGVRWLGFGVVGVALIGLSSSLEFLQGMWVVPMGLVSYGIYLTIADLFHGGGVAWYRFVSGITVFAAAMTVVRGSLLAIIVASIVALLLYSTFDRSRMAKLWLLGSISAVAVFVIFAIAFRNTELVQNSSYLKRVTDFSSRTTTVQTRFWAWSAGLNGWRDNVRTVLVGWGPENFNIPFSKYFNPKFYTGAGAETFFDRAHNMFVEVLVTMGVVGELAYLAIFATMFAVLARLVKAGGDHRILGIGLTALTIAYMIHNAFIFDTSSNFIAFFTIAAFVAHLGMHGIAGSDTLKTRHTRESTAQLVVAGALSLVVAALVYGTGLRPVMANFASTRAITAGWRGDFVTAVAKFQDAIAYDAPGRYEFRFRFAQYLVETGASADVSKTPAFIAASLSAINAVKQNIEENPLDYLPYLYLSRLYITLGKWDAASTYNQQALDYSTKALEISPTFVRTYYEVAQAYLNMKRYDGAFAAFKKAAELNPDVGTSFWYMGVVKYEQKDNVAALKYMTTAVEKGYGLSENDSLRLINLYVDVGDVRSVATIYENLTRDHPDNPQYFTSLAVAYARLGRRDDAIMALRKAMILNTDPAFQQQAQDFLRQLGAP